MNKRLGPLAFVLGVGGGAALAFGLGPHAPGWGATFAFPAVTLLLSLGAWKEDDGEEMLALLRLVVGFTGGYLAATVPVTWLALDAETSARVAVEIWARWAVIFLALPGGVTTFFLRMRRERAVQNRASRT